MSPKFSELAAVIACKCRATFLHCIIGETISSFATLAHNQLELCLIRMPACSQKQMFIGSSGTFASVIDRVKRFQMIHYSHHGLLTISRRLGHGSSAKTLMFTVNCLSRFVRTG